MKKKFLTLIIAFLCALICLSGCGLGSYIENNNNKDTPNKTEPEIPPDDPNDPGGTAPPADGKHYVVTVYLGTQIYKPADEEIFVVWRNDFSVERVLLGEDGTADAGELDGDYYIYLEGLSDKYTYNPSAYTATSEERKVSVLLTTVRSPESGDGKGLYSSEGCYQVKYDGTYRASVSGSNKVLYYEYKPEAAGYYSVTSWVNAFENDINPYIQLYNGTIGNKWFERRLDGGGFSVDGGYTKNFRYEYRIDRTEVGHAFTFAIGAESKSGDYPVKVDFAITYEGEYVSSNNDIRVIRAKEARIKAKEKSADEVFTYADFGKKNFDAKNFKFNDNTGFYHYYSETLYGNDPFSYGKNYGPILCCALTSPLPSYTITTLYNANAAGLGNGSNYLRMYNVWIEEEQKFAVFDYTAFVREDYYRVCNSEGMCYVTQELKEFLQTYAERQSLYTDGVGAGEGTPEYLGYTANQDALWLFACGVYLKTT
ncbi:MAG: hypothetical protein K2K28_04605 [Clostridia bacterium]|nr:hypothetical protein [Clostridia bacterium]